MRLVTEDLLGGEAHLFPVKKTPVYFPIETMGGRKKATQGDAFYTAANPPHGAVFTYYLKEDILSQKKQRLKQEANQLQSGSDTPFPGWDTVRMEDREDSPVVFLEVRDDNGNTVRRLKAPATKGFHRVAWDLCYPSMRPPRLQPRKPQAWEYSWDVQSGFPAAPGIYSVTLFKRIQGKVEPLGRSQTFECYSLNLSSESQEDQNRAFVFKKTTAELQRISVACGRVLEESMTQVKHLLLALDQTAGRTSELYLKTLDVGNRLFDLREILYGDETRWKRSEPARSGISERLGNIIYGYWRSSSAPTATMKRQLEIVDTALKEFRRDLHRVVETDLKNLFKEAEKARVPWTRGR